VIVTACKQKRLLVSKAKGIYPISPRPARLEKSSSILLSGPGSERILFRDVGRFDALL
jgi:hypothetical protein